MIRSLISYPSYSNFFLRFAIGAQTRYIHTTQIFIYLLLLLLLLFSGFCKSQQLVIVISQMCLCGLYSVGQVDKSHSPHRHHSPSPFIPSVATTCRCGVGCGTSSCIYIYTYICLVSFNLVQFNLILARMLTVYVTWVLQVSASKVLQETCNYIKNLHREVDDLSDRLSQLLATTDMDTDQAAIIRSLLM